MLNRTRFVAALLVASSAVLPGCGGDQGRAEAAAAPQARMLSGGVSVSRVFAHPGTPLTLSDLQTLKSYVDQGREPWKSGFNQLANDGKSRLTYVMAGPFAQVGRAPDLNLWPWRNDMVAIWNLSRMWYFTRNEDYARKARAILLAWATTQKEFSGRESMLDLGDYAYMFVGGADILRGTWSGWSEDDTATVKKYFKEVLIPASNPYGESQFGAANKGALALAAKGLMAIFNDDAATLDQVVYQTRTLAHIGLRSSNDIGMLGDSLRDQGHAYGQFRSLVMLAEALWKQGIDVYSDFDNRLLAAGEYFARVNELAPTPALPFGTTDAYYIADNTNRGWSGAGGGSIALNQVHGAYVIRKGLQAPFVTQRRQWTPVDGGSFMFLKDTDTSTATPAPALSIPATSSITAGFSNVDIGGATPAGSASYAAGKWTVKGAGSDIWGGGDSGHFTYVALTGDSAIVAKVESLQNTSVSAKAGVMMRTSLAPGAPRAWMAVTNRIQAEQNMQGLAVYGGSNYGNKALAIASATPSYWLKLERIGNIITGYISPDGTNWAATDVGRIDTPVPDTIYVGLVVASVANGTLNSSTFSNVQITGGDGAAPSVVPAAPAALLAAPGDGAVPLRWQRSFGATSYTVMRATASGGPYTAIASGLTGGSYTDKSVTNDVTYYYAVTASNAAGASGLSPADSATPARAMVNVAVGGAATDSAGNAANAGSAFDLNSATEWFYTGVSGWLRYDLGHTEVVSRYTVVSANDKVERDPRDWRFQGSNDGASWTTLDTQSNQVFASRYALKSYTIASPAAYRYYRLDITANNGDSTFTDLSEVGLFVSKP
ncbi:putative small secreted protein [Duganella sp. SG902]|uniref:discoidin domain-containing protein n=1 Tax=Duganella sp. SG902 TaxID=2587016 RepID=UPI00159E524C|nr:discoidin domain-containing protein [Duganella sp. SG902]NVM77900.1 putative small secreted protein [Duganella sp. SG902]